MDLWERDRMENILLAILVTRSAGAGDGAAMMYWAERSARRD